MEQRETDVGLKKGGRWGWGHRQGRGLKRGLQRLNPRGLLEEMTRQVKILRRRYIKEEERW